MQHPSDASPIPKWGRRISVTAVAAGAIAVALGGLAEPAVSSAAWDIQDYDSCVKAAWARHGQPGGSVQQLHDDTRFCCERSGGEWSTSRDHCEAPAAAQTDSTPTLPPNVTPGGTIVTRPSKAATLP